MRRRGGRSSAARRLLAWSALAVTLGGCAVALPPTVLLTLPAAADAPAGSPCDASPCAAAAAGPVLAVRRVVLPEYLLVRQVRFRTEASTVADWPHTYWAERIEVGVTRELAAALRARLPGWRVCDAGCGDAPPTVALQVELAPLDFARGTRRLHARARVMLSAGGGSPRLLWLGESGHDIDAAADSPQAQAQAIAELLRRLAAATAPRIAARP